MTAAISGQPAATGSTVSPAHAGRRPELDVMRAFVVAGLVIFHSAVVFAAGTSWFVKDPRPSAGFTVFLLWGSLWGMPLLFLVSGMGVCHALRTRSAAAFARERLGRLLVPFVVGLAVLVPPMFYLGRFGRPGFGESYGRFWLHVVNVPAIATGLLPRGSWTSGQDSFDPAHLWFLYVLLLFSLTLLPLFAYLRGPRGAALVAALAGFTERRPLVTLVGAAAPLALVEAVFGPDVNSGGWERVAYVFPFLYGFLIAADPRFETALRRARWPTLAAALLATSALIAWAAVLNASGLDVMTSVLSGWAALQGLAGWAWLVAILGFAGSLTTRRRNRPAITAPPTRSGRQWSHAGRYANEAVLPFYVLHEPIIVVAAWLIIRWNAPILGKYLVLVTVSFAGTLALYELLIRRFRLSRRLAGMKPARQPTAKAPPPPRSRTQPMTTQPPDPDPEALKHRIAGVFDRSAETYDQVGVDFFTPAARDLVARAAVHEGERVLDLGAGRGAALFAAAAAVGPSGRVVGIDLSPKMTALVRAEVTARGLQNSVTVAQGDAERPDFPDRSFDVVLASLVVFFLPGPALALRRYAALLTPGGRLGFTTFGMQDPNFDAAMRAIGAFVPDGMPPRDDRHGPFGSREGIAQLLTANGFAHPAMDEMTYVSRFTDPDHWLTWLWSHGSRRTLEQVPADQLDEASAAANRAFGNARTPVGDYAIHTQIRFTIAHAA